MKTFGRTATVSRPSARSASSTAHCSRPVRAGESGVTETGLPEILTMRRTPAAPIARTAASWTSPIAGSLPEHGLVPRLP